MKGSRFIEAARKSLIILGTGGFAAEVKWLVDDINKADRECWRIDAFIGLDEGIEVQSLDGISVKSEKGIKEFAPADTYFIIAIGNNKVRKEVATNMLKIDLKPATLIHPTVCQGQNVAVGRGCIIMPNAILAPHSALADFVIVNTATTVGHHCQVSAYSNICPGARLGGGSKAGEGALIGSNAVLHPKSKLGDWASLAPCSYLMRSTPQGTSWVGVPAKRFL